MVLFLFDISCEVCKIVNFFIMWISDLCKIDIINLRVKYFYLIFIYLWMSL